VNKSRLTDDAACSPVKVIAKPAFRKELKIGTKGSRYFQGRVSKSRTFDLFVRGVLREMVQAQKTAAEPTRPATRTARRRWWPSAAVLTGTLAVVLSVGWGTYSFFQRENVTVEPDSLDEFESFEPLTNTAEQTKQKTDGKEHTAPREFEEQASSQPLPVWHGSQPDLDHSTSGPPLGLTDHRPAASQAAFSSDAPSKSDAPAWLVGTIEADERIQHPTARMNTVFAQPDNSSLP
jgi:hypothetical protein